MTDLSRFDGICKHQALLDQPCEECEREESPPTDQQPMAEKPITREQVENLCRYKPAEAAAALWPIIAQLQQRAAELERLLGEAHKVLETGSWSKYHAPEARRIVQNIETALTQETPADDA